MTVRGGWPTRDKPHKLEAQFESTCPECGDEINIGDVIYWSDYHGGYVCSVGCR